MGVATSSECECDLSHVHILQPAASHKVYLVLHLCQGEDHIQILHFHELVDQDGEISNVFFSCHRGDDHLDPINHARRRRSGEIVQQPDLLGGEFPGEHVGNEIVIGPLFRKPCSGEKILRFCGRERERARIFMNAQAHDGGLVCRNGDTFVLYDPGKNGCGGSHLTNDFHLTMYIILRIGMMIINVDLHVIPV